MTILSKHFKQTALMLALTAPCAAMAAPVVNWTQWTSSGSGTTSQNAVSINVSYTGDTLGIASETGIYSNTGTFISAEVPNTPGDNNSIQLEGGTSTVSTFHFDHPVVNPYIALFSLGQPGSPLPMTFTTPFTILSQGAGHWGGGSLTTTDGLTVTGIEGNGVLKFTGTYTDISFVTTQHEYYFGATVGVSSVAAVPEAETYAMMLAGLGLVGAILRRRRA